MAAEQRDEAQLEDAEQARIELDDNFDVLEVRAELAHAHELDELRHAQQAQHAVGARAGGRVAVAFKGDDEQVDWEGAEDVEDEGALWNDIGKGPM